MKTLPVTRIILGIFLLLSVLSGALAQVAPTAEPVYGGYVEWIAPAELDATTTRVFAATLSANTVFYMDVDHSGAAPVFSTFQTVPDLDWDDGYGAWVRSIAADAASGFIFVASGNEGFVATDINSGSLYVIDPMPMENVEVHDGYLFYLKMMGSDLYLSFRLINPDGSVGTEDSILITSSFTVGPFLPDIIISPADDHVYVFNPGTPPELYKTSDTYDMLSSASTTVSSLTTTDLAATSLEYFAACIAPDGRIFVGGYEGVDPGRYSFYGYSDADGDPWTTFNEAGVDGGWAKTMTAVGDATTYKVFFGRGYSASNGVNGSWQHLPNTDVGGHVMDGPVAVDPLDEDVLYFRTDWGFGASSDGAVTVDEVNDGLVAVQVDGFAMDETKNVAWVASKSGVWQVTDYQTTPVWLTTPLWPQMDTTPYSAVATSVTGDTVFAGNSSLNAFRYESADGALTNSNFERILNEGDGHFTQNSRITNIEIDPTLTGTRVAVSVYDSEDHGEGDEFGGVLVGEDDGTSWTWTRVTGGDWPASDADVNDVLFVEESGTAVIYAGVDYFNHTTGNSARSIYRMEDDGAGGWTVTQDMLNATQNITATICDLWATSSGDIYACGTDAGTNHPVIYAKYSGDTEWTSLTSGATGLPTGGTAKAVTVDEATGDVYIAVENELYVLMSGATAWTLYYEYPVGTFISFIYYDELLVGTATGLYSHAGAASAGEPPQRLLPGVFELNAWPNPFNPSTTIEVQVGRQADFTVEVFNLLGQRVATIQEGRVEAGAHAFTWNAETFGAGIYFIVATGSEQRRAKKVVLLK